VPGDRRVAAALRAGLEDVEKRLTSIITRSGSTRRFGIRWALLGQDRIGELIGQCIHKDLVVTLAIGDDCSAPTADLSKSCIAVGPDGGKVPGEGHQQDVVQAHDCERPAVKGDRLEALYILALTTGMREGGAVRASMGGRQPRRWRAAPGQAAQDAILRAAGLAHQRRGGRARAPPGQAARGAAPAWPRVGRPRAGLHEHRG
jgi:hypothetical protein